MKLFGAVLIILSSSLYGWLRSQNSRELYNRAMFLSDLLNELSGYLLRSSCPILTAIDGLSYSSKYRRFSFLSAARQLVEDGAPLGQALSDEFMQREENRLLNKEDFDSISTALACVCGINPTSEAAALKAAADRLGDDLAKRRNEILNRQKLEMVLFPLLGCAISVMLL